MTTLYISLIIILCAIIFIITEGMIKKAKCEGISFKESMDLTDLPVITFTQGDQKLNFLLDTGSNASHINKGLVDNGTVIVSITGNNQSLYGMNGLPINIDKCLMEFKYKDTTFKSEFLINDLSLAFETVKRDSGVQIHGILGNKFFQEHKYILDFDNLKAYSNKDK